MIEVSVTETAAPEILGEVAIDRYAKVPLDVYRHVLDPVTRQPNGYLRFERMRTRGEVARDLAKHLDVEICDKCGHSRPRRTCSVGSAGSDVHGKKCGGTYHWQIDEYLSLPEGREADDLVPRSYHVIACYAVTGANEGHRVYVEIRGYLEGRAPLGDERNASVVRILGIKTFQGMDYARKLANLCADLLGA